MMAEIPAWIFTLANACIAVVFAVVLLSLYSKQTNSIVTMTERWSAKLNEVTERWSLKVSELVEKSTSALMGVQAAIVTLQALVASLCEEVRSQRRGN